jgi:2-haloacid dehalogenase
MRQNRRELLQVTAGAMAGLVLAPLAFGAGRTRFKAIAFDGFAIVDPRPVFALAEELFPGKGSELGSVWRTHQFEYAWLRTFGHRYVDFSRVTEEALVFASKVTRLDLSAEKRQRLMAAFLQLKAWPDVLPALKKLRAAGIRMAFLANLTPAMLDAVTRNSGLGDLLEEPLSTDRVRAYKPDPRAYQMSLDAFGLRREEIVFAASAGWDVAGAKWFGYPTFWVNRTNLPAEELGVVADGSGADLGALVDLVLAPG